jgi:hypothetical protein
MQYTLDEEAFVNNNLKSCTITTITDSENVHHLNISLPPALMILGHLPIKLWTLITFAYGIQISHDSVRRNPLSIAST